MGLILDIVPNHMATDDANRYWADPELRERFFDLDAETGRHRRFFDIDHLAAVRQEDEAVFEETHSLALALVREGIVDGLRIDHPDGLADPAGYLRRLREGGARARLGREDPRPRRAAARLARRGHGRLRVPQRRRGAVRRPGGRGAADRAVGRDLRRRAAVRRLRGRGQARAGATTFAPEVERLRREAPREVERARRALASLPVYRTYVEPWSGLVDPRTATRSLEAGCRVAGRVLRLDERGWDAFVTRFQQTTPPVMAKGVEDTAFYRYGGCSRSTTSAATPAASASRRGLPRGQRRARGALPAQPARHPDARHQALGRRAGADRRALGDGRASGRRTCAALARPARRHRAGPDDVERYLIFQTLAGAWPIERERLQAYLEKALREAKRTTSWVEPDEAHEAARAGVLPRCYEHEAFLADFEPFAAELAAAGDRAALGQLLLKLTVPGVPDVYQGDELLSLSLVDPDNRRPVDWALPEVELAQRALADRGVERRATPADHSVVVVHPRSRAAKRALHRGAAEAAALRLRHGGDEPHERVAVVVEREDRADHVAVGLDSRCVAGVRRQSAEEALELPVAGAVRAVVDHADRREVVERDDPGRCAEVDLRERRAHLRGDRVEDEPGCARPPRRPPPRAGTSHTPHLGTPAAVGLVDRADRQVAGGRVERGDDVEEPAPPARVRDDRGERSVDLVRAAHRCAPGQPDAAATPAHSRSRNAPSSIGTSSAPAWRARQGRRAGIVLSG